MIRIRLVEPGPWRKWRAGERTHQAATGFLRGRPRGRLRATTTPWTKSCPPQTPHGSRRSRAPARHSLQCRAGPAERLGELDVRRALGEPELGVVLTARDVLAGGCAAWSMRSMQCGELHRCHLPSVVPHRSRRGVLVTCHLGGSRPCGGGVRAGARFIWHSASSVLVFRAASRGAPDNTKAADPGCRVPRPGGDRCLVALDGWSTGAEVCDIHGGLVGRGVERRGEGDGRGPSGRRRRRCRAWTQRSPGPRTTGVCEEAAGRRPAGTPDTRRAGICVAIVIVMFSIRATPPRLLIACPSRPPVPLGWT